MADIVITEPCLVADMEDVTYHGDPVPSGSLSSSLARQLTKYVPAKAIALHRNRKPTATMNLGKAAHRLALGAGPNLITWEHDGRTKLGKAERAEHAEAIATETEVAVTEAERDQIHGMVDALRANPDVAAMIDSANAEVSAFWSEGGTWCRARYDLLGDLPYDYKTTDDASSQGFAESMATWGYHQQAEFYQRGLRALAHPAADQPMRFICQEKQAPYLVQVHTCDDLAMEIAAELNTRAIAIFAACNPSNYWPGYPCLEPEPTALPNYYFYRHAAVIPANLNPFFEA